MVWIIGSLIFMAIVVAGCYREGSLRKYHGNAPIFGNKGGRIDG